MERLVLRDAMNAECEAEETSADLACLNLRAR
jgi:hypothetical protein